MLSKFSSLTTTDETRGDMTPMIDVVFQLLIFFMLTIKFRTLDGKLAAFLPADVGVNPTATAPVDKLEISLRVEREGARLMPRSDQPWDGTGAFRYGPDRVIRYAIGPRSTTRLGEAARLLDEFHRANPDAPATIDPHPGTVYADVVLILDKAIEVGFRDVSFAGARSAATRR